MQIDMILDPICPWCFIGKKRLDRALAQIPDRVFDVRMRAYQLDPSIPPEGMDRRAYLAAKFGESDYPRAAGEALEAAGTVEGIDFRFDAITRTPNTRDAHRLLRWARSLDLQGAVADGLFAAYFEEGLDIGAPAVLGAIAERAGMDGEIVSELLGSEADIAAVAQEDSLARRMGIGGVPTYLIGGRVLIQGAEDPDAILASIARADALLAAEAAEA